MQTQSFLLKDPVTLPSADELTAERDRHHQLLRSTGFNAAHQWEAGKAGKFDTAAMLFPEMTGKQLKLWRQFLPTTVEPREHRFDTPPVEALELIESARELRCFDSIEIWTPEGNSFLGLVARKANVAQEKLRELGDRLDPMAVGVLTDRSGTEHYYQIARWGEALKDLKQIKRQVASINMRARLLFVLLPVLALFMGFSAYYQGIERFGYGNMLGMTFVALFVAAGLCLCIAVTADMLGW